MDRLRSSRKSWSPSRRTRRDWREVPRARRQTLLRAAAAGGSATGPPRDRLEGVGRQAAGPRRDRLKDEEFFLAPGFAKELASMAERQANSRLTCATSSGGWMRLSPRTQDHKTLRVPKFGCMAWRREAATGTSGLWPDVEAGPPRELRSGAGHLGPCLLGPGSWWAMRR